MNAPTRIRQMKESLPMDYELRLLETRFGGRWCGVKFGKNPGMHIRRAGSPMRFCEAIAASRTGPIRLTPELLDCPGGSRCLGWNTGESDIADAMTEKAGLECEAARQILRTTPHLEGELEEIVVGIRDTPDVVVSYSQPEAVMKLTRQWQASRGQPINMELSGFLSVCGMVAVKAYLTGEICISFGCPDAREYGSIGRDRLVVGLPAEAVHILAGLLSPAALRASMESPDVKVQENPIHCIDGR
jgi:uncharacterized protein (DUF169 family)